MSFLTRRAWMLRSAALVGPGLGQAVHAQPAGWPSRPIRLIVVYPVGGVSDLIARALSHKLAERWQTSVVVDNRAGASGSVGMAALAAAPADGYTLAFSAITPLSLLPHLTTLPYDPTTAIAPVSAVMSTPALLVGTSAFDGQRFADLLAPHHQATVQRWATTGVGTTGHLVLEQVRAATGIHIVHIPYKGGARQLNDALSGQFELLSTNAGAAQFGHIRAGRLKALAVGAAARLDALPGVPTFDELGLPQANLASLFGLFAPAGLPADIVAYINQSAQQIIAQPEMRALLAANDSQPVAGDAASFAQRIKQESASSRRIVKAAKMRLTE